MRRAACAAGCLAFVTKLAAAHLEFPAARAERTLELRLEESPIRIVYRIGWGAELAEAERKIADRDRNGTVSAGEGNQRLDARSAELLRTLRVCTGPALDAVRCSTLTSKQIALVEADGWSSEPNGHLHLAWTLTIAADASEIAALRIEDDWQLPEIEISEVRIEPAEQQPLLAAGEGDAPRGVARRLTWIEARRGTGPRVVGVAWRPARRGWLVLLAVAALAGTGALVYRTARRKQLG